MSSSGVVGSYGSLQRPASRLIVRHLPTLSRRRCSVSGQSSRRAPAPFYEHLGGYAMHELRDFNRHPRWHDDQWRVPPIVTCRLHGNSVLTETRDGSVFVTMLWFPFVLSLFSVQCNNFQPDLFMFYWNSGCTVFLLFCVLKTYYWTDFTLGLKCQGWGREAVFLYLHPFFLPSIRVPNLLLLI